jgi:hypothetical protein
MEIDIKSILDDPIFRPRRTPQPVTPSSTRCMRPLVAEKKFAKWSISKKNDFWGSRGGAPWLPTYKVFDVDPWLPGRIQFPIQCPWNGAPIYLRVTCKCSTVYPPSSFLPKMTILRKFPPAPPNPPALWAENLCVAPRLLPSPNSPSIHPSRGAQKSTFSEITFTPLADPPVQIFPP